MSATADGGAAVFLDRDGVLNEIVERDGVPGSPRSLAELRLVRDIDAVARLKEAGLLVFLITNQPDVARGHVTREEQAQLIARVIEAAPVDDYRVCEHEDRHACECRKPKPGMILDLARRWHVDVSRSFVIGDTWRDVDAGRAAGCTSILIRRPYNTDARPDVAVTSLAEAVEAVLSHAA